MLAFRTLLVPFLATYLASFAVLAILWRSPGLPGLAPGSAAGFWLILVLGAGATGVLAALLEFTVRRPLVGMHARLTDDRKERESRLRLFASAVESAEDAIAIIDGSGGISYLNPAFEELVGHPASDLMTHPDWRTLVFAEHEMDPGAFCEGRWEGTAEISRTDGTVRTVDASTTLLTSPDEAGRHWVVLMRDMTERNQQLERIQELATAVETIEDCIIIADRSGAVRYANPAYEKRCNMPLDQMLGRQTNSMEHATSSQQTYTNLRNTVLAGRVWRGELQASFADGRNIIEEAVVSPVKDKDGQVINYVTTLHDVTERVQMETELRLANEKARKAKDQLEERVALRTEELREAKEAAEAASHAKSAFLATVSHEIRTPLNGILGMLELLADHPLRPQQKRLLHSADTSATLLLSLINDILDFSKIEAGQLQLDETGVSLREVTESVVLSLAPAAHRKQVRLQSLFDPALPATVRLDGVRLQQILLNLLGNAVKFTSSSDDREGLVTLNVSQQMSEDRPYLCLAVTDNGIGIAPEALGTLFVPFTQAESSTTRRFGGTGLGLSISSRLVRLMGGDISVVSTLDEGSTFTVMLPLHEAHPDEISRLPPLPAVRGESEAEARWDASTIRGKILIAEDNPINQDVIKLQLKALGFDSDVAADGREALRLWQAGHYDLVLTDCHMPNMDGFELARAIRAAEAPGQHTPIVALTANVLSEEARHCRAAGMEECLTKPIQRRRLDKTLTVHLTASALRNPTPATRPTGPAPAARAATASEPLLNMTTFADHLDCDTATQHELLQRLASDAHTTPVTCANALAQEAWETLRCTAHKLKSAVRTVGAERLADVCVAIEAASVAADTAELEKLLKQLSELLAQLRREIDNEVNRRGQSAEPAASPALVEQEA